MADFRECPSCGSSHIGPPCGLSFADRLKTVQVDGAVLETRSKQNYFDDESIGRQLSPDPDKPMDRKDREELYMDQTDGLGLVKTTSEGRLVRKDNDGNTVRLNDAQTRNLMGDVAE